MDTLAFGCILPATGRIRDFHPLERALAGRTTQAKRASVMMPSYFHSFRLIGQKTCYKTAIAIEISMAIAVLSFLKEDRGWTKNVFRMLVNS